MKDEFFTDLLNVQKSIETFKRSANNPFFKSKYLELPELLETIKPILNDNNFILMQLPEFDQVTNKNILRTKLLHKSGETLESDIEIMCKDKNDPQKLGSGITYVRRYSLTAMLGISEKDDDGNSGSSKKENKNNNQSSENTDNVRPSNWDQMNAKQKAEYNRDNKTNFK